MSYKISKLGKMALHFEEGKRNKPYIDEAGNKTIGMGHVLKPGEDYKSLSDYTVNKLFLEDIQEREDYINGYLNIPWLKQHQYDALFIFMFNIGHVGFFKRNSVYKWLLSNNIPICVSYWKQYNKVRYKDEQGNVKYKVSDVLKARRRREINLFYNDLKSLSEYKAG